jgi:hypothetical protein
MALIAMRVARPTVDLDRLRSFYEHVVGLPLLGSFTHHDGYDGAIFGLPDERAQLEIVRSPHGDVPAPTNEDALVLYHEDGASPRDLIERLHQSGATEVTVDDPTLNPYWARQGARCFVDPDGFRVILVST